MSEDSYVIHINMPVAKGRLIDEIKALPKITAPPKKKKPVVEEASEPLILSKVSKPKKDKKKKKKSELGANLFGNIYNDDEEDRFDEVIERDNLIDIDEIYNRDDDDDGVGDPIIDEQRRGYEKRKKDTNPFKKEFAEELTLLYDLLDDMNKLSKELDKKYKTLENSKVRGVSKYTNDMVINMLSAKTNKLQIVKEINSLKKTIADLKIKADAKEKGAAGETSVDLMASQYFQKVLQHGRGNFVKQMGGSTSMSQGMNGIDDEDGIDELISSVERAKRGYSDDDVDEFDRLIEDRLETEANPFRTEEGTRNIQYESAGPKIIVKKCTDTGEWEFIAVDRDNQQIFGYPIPDKRMVGKMKFTDDYATDDLGRMYKVIEYWSNLEEEDEDDGE